MQPIPKRERILKECIPGSIHRSQAGLRDKHGAYGDMPGWARVSL